MNAKVYKLLAPYICMVEQTQTIEEPNAFVMTIKMNAKREIYGEYTVKADTAEDLATRLDQAGQLFVRLTSRR